MPHTLTKAIQANLVFKHIVSHSGPLCGRDHREVTEKQTCVPSPESKLVMILMSCVYVMPNTWLYSQWPH